MSFSTFPFPANGLPCGFLLSSRLVVSVAFVPRPKALFFRIIANNLYFSQKKVDFWTNSFPHSTHRFWSRAAPVCL